MKRILLLLICVGLGAIPVISLPANVESKSAAQIPNGASQAAEDKAEFQQVLDLVNDASSANDDLRRAAQLAEQMLTANPRSAYGYAAKAEVYYRARDYGYPVSSEVVQSIAEKAIALDPKLGDPHTVLARLDLDKGMGDDAEDEADTAYRLAPRSPESLFIEARISVVTHQWSRAESFYNKDIAALAPNTARQANIYWWLSRMYLAESPPNVDAANQAFKKCADLDPQNPDNAVYYADFLIQWTHDLDGVQRYAKKAIKIDNSSEARTDLGIAAYGKWAENYLAHKREHAATATARDLKAVEAHTGLSAEYVFDNESTTKELGIITEALLDAGAIKNVDTIPQGDTNTAFVGAAYADNFKLAKLLLKHGANINSADTDNKSTGLMYFVKNGNVPAVEYLLGHGARVNLVNGNGVPLVQLALPQGQDRGPKMAELLLAHGADPTITNSDGNNLLFVAVAQNQIQLITLLLHRYKMDVNAPNSNGITALAVAVMSLGPYKELVHTLLAAGANPWVYSNGKTDILSEMFPIHPDYKVTLAMIESARKHYPKPRGFVAARLMIINNTLMPAPR